METLAAHYQKNGVNSQRNVASTAACTMNSHMRFGVNCMKNAETNVIAAMKDKMLVSAPAEKLLLIELVTHQLALFAVKTSGVRDVEPV